MFLIGIGMNAILSEVTTALANRHYRQLHPEFSLPKAELEPGSIMVPALQMAWRYGWSKTAGMLAFSPVGLYSAWLAFSCLLRWRKSVRGIVFGNRVLTLGQRVIWWLVLLCGFSTLVYPFGYPLAVNSLFPLPLTALLGYIATLFACFARTFLTAGLIQCAIEAANGKIVSVDGLLDIETEIFKRLLLFNFIVFAAVGILQMTLIFAPRQFADWHLTSVARLLIAAQGFGLHYVLPVSEIAIFLIPFFIVLHAQTIRHALLNLSHSWSRHLKVLLALILPLLFSAMLLEFVERFFAMQAADSLLTKAGTRIGVNLVSALLSSIWLIATAQLFSQIQPVTTINNPETRS